jgi:hypothetical protein
MLYLLAAIGLVTVGVLFWRLLGHDRIGVSAPRSTIAPDDDPDFLRRLGEQTRRDDGPDNPA